MLLLGYTPLHNACGSGNAEAIAWLVEVARVCSPSKLFIATPQPKLLRSGCPLAPGMLQTWLLDLCESQKLLIHLPSLSLGIVVIGGVLWGVSQARADVGIKSETGATAVHVAVLNQDELKTCTPDKREEVTFIFTLVNYGVVSDAQEAASLRMLKHKGVNLDTPAFGGNTAVHEAVLLNSTALRC
eukprot:1279653-Amphidinium_carterae.1